MKSAIVVVLLLSLASVSWAGQPIRPSALLFAYDANGKKIGTVLDVVAPPAYANVALRIRGIATTGTLSPDGLFVGAARLLFQSTDCTGTLYIEDSPRSIFKPLATSDPGSTVYGQQPGSSAQAISAGSEKQGSQCMPYTNPKTVQAFPAVPLVDLSTLFTPPFMVR